MIFHLWLRKRTLLRHFECFELRCSLGSLVTCLCVTQDAMSFKAVQREAKLKEPPAFPEQKKSIVQLSRCCLTFDLQAVLD